VVRGANAVSGLTLSPKSWEVVSAYEALDSVTLNRNIMSLAPAGASSFSILFSGGYHETKPRPYPDDTYR
jgi:hypothetical protein